MILNVVVVLVIAFAIRQCTARASALITRKTFIPRKKKSIHRHIFRRRSVQTKKFAIIVENRNKTGSWFLMAQTSTLNHQSHTTRSVCLGSGASTERVQLGRPSHLRLREDKRAGPRGRRRCRSRRPRFRGLRFESRRAEARGSRARRDPSAKAHAGGERAPPPFRERGSTSMLAQWLPRLKKERAPRLKKGNVKKTIVQ